MSLEQLVGDIRLPVADATRAVAGGDPRKVEWITAYLKQRDRVNMECTGKMPHPTEDDVRWAMLVYKANTLT